MITMYIRKVFDTEDLNTLFYIIRERGLNEKAIESLHLLYLGKYDSANDNIFFSIKRGVGEGN